MIDPPPPRDEEVSYVGVWLDDLAGGELYERDRWAPFIRCVLSWVGQEADWLRHARPLFGGTSFRAEVWYPRFRRSQVEGIFVEVPRSIAPRLKEGLHTSLSVRGVLQIEQLDERAFLAHSLANSAWLLGDTCIHRGYTEGSELHEEAGLRMAYPREDEAGHPYLSLGPRVEVDHILAGVVARGIHVPKGRPTRRSPTPTPVEILVVRTEVDLWNAEPTIPAFLVLFDLHSAPPGFEDHLIEVVSSQLVRKAYKSEVLLWSWIGEAAHYPKTYYAAITTSEHQRAGRTAALFKGVRPAYYEAGEDRLQGNARPLLRWRPSEGLTRFWTAAPPPDTVFINGKHSAHLRHRVPHVVRAADEPRELRVDALELHHVRNYDSPFEHRFAPHFNVIIGDNARGKTTLLDALAGILRAVTSPKDKGASLRRMPGEKAASRAGWSASSRACDEGSRSTCPSWSITAWRAPTSQRATKRST